MILYALSASTVLPILNVCKYSYVLPAPVDREILMKS